MNGQTISYNAVWFSNKKAHITGTCNDINKSEKHTEWKQPAMKCVIPFIWSSEMEEAELQWWTW